MDGPVVTATETNHYEAMARARKVSLLVDAARTIPRPQAGTRGYTADEVAAFSRAEWELLAEYARCHIPGSDLTEAMVVDALATLNAQADDDPFLGL